MSAASAVSFSVAVRGMAGLHELGHRADQIEMEFGEEPGRAFTTIRAEWDPNPSHGCTPAEHPDWFFTPFTIFRKGLPGHTPDRTLLDRAARAFAGD